MLACPAPRMPELPGDKIQTGNSTRLADTVQPSLANVTHLDVGSFSASDKELELVLQVADDGRFDRDGQVLLRARILQDDGEGVVDVAVDAAVRAQEARHGRRRAEQKQSLVERMRALKEC